LQLAIGITHYYVRRGFLLDGISWLEKLGLDRDVARALNAEGAELIYLGRDAEAKHVFERALPLAQRSGDVRYEGHILSSTAYLICESEPPASRDLYVQALRCYSEAGDETLLAMTLNAIAAFDYVAERYDAANEHLERALAIHRELGNTTEIAGTVGDLGDVAPMRGSTSLARDYYAEALGCLDEREAVLSYPSLLSGIARVAAQAGRPRDAARLLGAARFSRRRDAGTRQSPRTRARSRARGGGARPGAARARDRPRERATPQRSAAARKVGPNSQGWS
jgi:tetratricopeptide (TPR) repeat protein